MSDSSGQREVVAEELLLPLSWEQGWAEALGDAEQHSQVPP